MSKNSTKHPHCAWCGEVIPHHDLFRIHIIFNDGSNELVLGWHMSKCLAEDPLHDEYATLQNLPDDAKIGKEVLDVYVMFHNRIYANFGAAGLKKCIAIPRGNNWRNPGSAWGTPGGLGTRPVINT